ncbi:MAG: ABC transporter ATP-binding protein [Actinomycetota bacterium]|nr:ABC transporter ATP-binding protein [Actinomycetota bacterium]
MAHLGSGMHAGLRTFRRDDSVRGHRFAPGTWRRILGFARPYRRLLTVFITLIVLDAAGGTVTPLLFRAIINDGIGHRDVHLIVVLAVVAGLLAILDTAFGIGERAVSARVGEGLIFDLRSRVFAHVQTMPVAFFTRTQTGALVSRLNNDVLGAQQAFTDTLSNVVSNSVTVVLVVTAMLFLSWPITLVALALLPLFVLPAKRFGRRLQTITREAYNLNAELTTMMTERFNVAGALLVKLFGRPASERSAFDLRAGRVRDIGITQAMYARVFLASLMLTASLATVLVYGWGGVLSVHGGLTVGTLVALTAYLSRLYGPLTALSNVQVDVLSAAVSFERVLEVLDLPPMIAEAPGAVDLPTGPARVELDHVRFAYPGASEVSLASLESVAVAERAGRVEVLHDVSLSVEPGRLVALVGPSGAGKTTIGHLLSRLYDPDEGAVRIGGIDLREATLASVQATVGVVTQDAHLFHDTLRANLLYVRPEATEADLYAALDAAQVRELVDRLPDGLDTVVGDRGYRLSGGEKQRVAIARLLLKAPGIVLLDEATAHLDSESEAAVQRALERALAGRTSLVIAHRLSTVRAADEIVVLQAGRVVERGQHRDLLAAGGLYAELYRTQFDDAVGSTGSRDGADVEGAVAVEAPLEGATALEGAVVPEPG